MAKTYHWRSLSADADQLNGQLIDEKSRVLKVHRNTSDPALRERLWRASEPLVGLG